MKRLLFASFLLLSAGFSSAQSQHCLADRYSQDTLFTEAQIDILSDVEYAQAMSWNDTLHHLKMDIYQPNQSLDPLEKRPLILMTHGGSFAVGNKSDMAYYALEMAQRGFVTASINYRLGWNCDVQNENPCSTCTNQSGKLKEAVYMAVQDHRAALRYLVHEADNLGIDTAFIFVQGESAGAITSLSSAFWSQAEAEAFCSSCLDAAGLLDTSGNALTDNYTIKGVVNSCGGIPNMGQGVLNGHDIPVIGFHAEWDCVVPYGSGPVINCPPITCGSFFWVGGSNGIRGQLHQNGVCYQMNQVLASFEHCSGSPPSAIVGKSACFLKEIMCDNCTSSTSTQMWDIPDCSAGGFVSVEDVEARDWVKLNGNQLVFDVETQISSVQVVDLSMRLVANVSVPNANQIELPSSLSGCMFVKIDAETQESEMLKWCNF
jgi:hypothetical protein